MSVVKPGQLPVGRSISAPNESMTTQETRSASKASKAATTPSSASDQFEAHAPTARENLRSSGLQEPRAPDSSKPNASNLGVPPPLSETIETKSGLLSGLKEFLGFGESINNIVNPQMDISYALHKLGHGDSLLGRATLRGESKEVKLRTAAHLLGIGGTLANPKVRLEGLGRIEASKTLDPMFREALELTRSLLAQSTEHRALSKVLHQEVKSFREPTSHSRFTHDLQVALRSPSGNAEHPCTWMTGWREPSGHAVGLVFDRVDGECRLYLSNAGDEAFSDDRTVTGFEVQDVSQFLTTLRAAGRDDQLIRKLWHKDGMKLWGLGTLKGNAQLPDKLQRSYQKRGNCPLASRKGCVLAALWSRRPVDTPSADVKKTYKIFTTLLRRQGMELALRENNTELIKRGMVAMLGKSDRPDCLRLLYRAADHLAESHGLYPLQESWDRLESAQLREDPYLSYLQAVFKRAGVDIDQTDESGLNAYQRAKALDRKMVAAFIKKVRS